MRIAVTLLLCVLAPAVVAQSFPAKPLRIVVRAPPGGTDELLGRLIAPKMGALLGQPVAVDYRTGAAGLAASFAPISSRSPIAETVLVAVAPGGHVIDPTQYAYTKLRAGVRLYPLGPVFEAAATRG
jgi:tripartite-type tricarboxylate transporter receptor subunit TctC